MDTKKSKIGRPYTNLVNRKTIKLSNGAIELLASQRNKSAFIDALVRGEVTQVKCPKCGEIITIKTIEV